MGDALGLSTVHVNRTLMELRGMGLVSWRGATLTVLDWEELKRVGDFRGGFQNWRARRLATRKMHALCSSDWMMKPSRS
jgi:hypothetical protein